MQTEGEPSAESLQDDVSDAIARLRRNTTNRELRRHDRMRRAGSRSGLTAGRWDHRGSFRQFWSLLRGEQFLRIRRRSG